MRSSIGGKEDAGLIAQVDQARSTLQETEEEISQLKEQADTLRDEGEKASDLDAKL